jgi:glycosyltransferase involved in cell wall biosynthesis
LPEAALALYGPGSESLLAAGVHAFGELHRPQALALMAACDVFVRPTLADGDAISVREAIALGRPVVASAVGARPPEARLFPAGDAAACAEEIFQTVSHRLPENAPPVDCLPTLLRLYGRVDAQVRAVATGTGVATGP